MSENLFKYDEDTNSFRLSLNIINESDNELPKYETEGASGFDIKAFLPDGVVILEPGEFRIIPTGLRVNFPEGFEIQIRPRSGLAAKHGVTVLNSPGTIDADYTGLIGIILINHSKLAFAIKTGDRIAQGVFATVLSKRSINLVTFDGEVKKTDRGDGGYGSTGNK